MSCGVSGSLYDLSGNLIENTYGRLAQIIPSSSAANTTRSLTPTLYDGYGNEITGIRMQEAFDRDSDGNLQPTEGPFYDMFWEEDSDGNKMPRDIKFWLDDNYNLMTLEADKTNLKTPTFIQKTTVTSNYTITDTDSHIGFDTTNNSITVTLPSANHGTREFTFKDEGFYSKINNLTLVSENNNDTFEDNQSSLILNENGISITLYSNGVNKYFIK